MADTGKKRKRVASGIIVPNKKAAQLETSTTSDYGDENSLPPVIAASRGITAPAVTFAAYSKPHSTILHSSQHSRLDFTAIPTEDELRHYVAVIDGNNIQIIPAQHTQLQCVPRTAPVEESSRKSIANQRVALGQEFGTKKAKKVIASRTVNAITSAGNKEDVKNAILEEVAVITGKEEVVELATQLAAKPIPTPVLDADAVEKVYPLTTLIPAGDMRSIPIKEWQEKARADENIQQPHRFTAYRVAAFGKTNDISRLKALRYVGLLLQFHDALSKAGRAGMKVPRKDILAEKLKEFPEGLVDSVRRKFSDEKNELSKWHMENLHTHICALSLYVDNWSTDTSNIRDDLRLDNRGISQYFMELGCKVGKMTEKERTEKKLNVAQANTVRMARLQLPLEFPKLKTGRRK
ncbi:hypothetical protein AMS68_005362 [Peltaster fructicola]|uniref:RNA polymerase I associated factor, A49-like protein n=1 Tax=Peltaster fructicola TaxID=286661 RepID=A0A6H0XYV1_9PEZI|nr:hypothetical protein AMS68_005362 [Peltaster fructicola]